MGFVYEIDIKTLLKRLQRFYHMGRKKATFYQNKHFLSLKYDKTEQKAMFLSERLATANLFWEKAPILLVIYIGA